MEDIPLDLTINNESLDNLLPPATGPMLPVRETQMEAKDAIPGPKTIVLDYDGTGKSQHIVNLCISLFDYVLNRKLHLLVASDAPTKRKWSRAYEQLHNHLLHPDEWPGFIRRPNMVNSNLWIVNYEC